MNTLRLSHARAGAAVQPGVVAHGQQPLHDGGWEPGEVRGRGTVEGRTAGGWERDVLGVWREGGRRVESRRGFCFLVRGTACGGYQVLG
jgi:hypothetical protein